MEENARKFILNNPILKQSEICREIGWNVSSMNLWLHGKRGITKEKFKLLLKVLKKYCFEKR
jgi:hypothetical protein